MRFSRTSSERSIHYRFTLERPEPLDEVLPKLLQSACAEAARPLKRPNYRNSELISEGAGPGNGEEGGRMARLASGSSDRTTLSDVDAEPETSSAPIIPGDEDSATESASVSSLNIDPETVEIKDQLQQLHQELQNITDEEKVAAAAASSPDVGSTCATAAASSSTLSPLPDIPTMSAGFTVAPTVPSFHAPYMRKIKDSNGTDLALASRPYLETVFKALECVENDYDTLFALTLIYAMGHNVGINRQFAEATRLPVPDIPSTRGYNSGLAERLILILSQSCKR